MTRILLLTDALEPSAEILPALGLLAHAVRTMPADAAALVDAPEGEVILVDARRELVAARSLCRVLHATGTSASVFAVVTEGGLAAISPEWHIDDVLVTSAGPAEVEARLRLRLGAKSAAAPGEEQITAGEVVVDEASYSAKLRGRTLDLTYKEFELLKYLVQHPGRVFTRTQLLQEVWGYDYYGGTRTVDVHVRRLRAKLGVDHEALIGTVRNVGYRFVPDATTEEGAAEGGSGEGSSGEGSSAEGNEGGGSVRGADAEDTGAAGSAATTAAARGAGAKGASSTSKDVKSTQRAGEAGGVNTPKASHASAQASKVGASTSA